jgi:actin cytoskeleton-regulatory complex protein SLA1
VLGQLERDGFVSSVTQTVADKHSSRQMPDPKKLRTWTTDPAHSKLPHGLSGYGDGKIRLHKQNGVSIAVPTFKLRVDDLEYVEKVAGVRTFK